MKKYIFSVLVAGLFFLGGCAFFDEKESYMEKTAEQLASEGSIAFHNEKYRDAVKAYTDLRDWYPFSKYAILAELKIADSYFFLKEYPQAVAAYESFERLHPRNEAIPYVISQIGMCWFKRIDTIDRDQTPARNALNKFEILTAQFPDSPQAMEAGKYMEKCIENLASQELYIADYYMKVKKYNAACQRYKYLIGKYPDTSQGKEAVKKLSLCQSLL